MTHLGIDPGVAGGIAVLDDAGAVKVAVKMPATERDLLDLLEQYRAFAPRAVLERAAASPQMGTVSAFTFGVGYGRLQMALVAAQIPFDKVPPGVWQQAMGVRQKTGKTALGSTHKKDKNVAKRRAQELFPGVAVTHATADALLLAEYGRRLVRGLLPRALPPDA